ncbi:MAG: nucleotidyltransferase family protein [Candidatus Helarchaeota archaeon]|nr:nucleotidyltransferase family protein [Candidatus Helarchaeota archaeon]
MSELDKEKIFELLRLNKLQLQKYGVKRIGLFGSYLRGENKKESDIDFLVEFEEGKKNYDNFIELAFFLEELFNRRVDLLTIESMSPYLKPYILKEVRFETIKAL